MRFTFSGEVVHWRGPAPHHFVGVPPEDAEDLAARVTLTVEVAE